MKILHCVESYYPSIGGMQEVVKQLSERLVSLGHEVTVATRLIKNRNSKIINGVVIEEFDIIGNKVNGYKGNDTERYQQFLLQSNYDTITFFAAQQWATDLALDLLAQLNAKKISVPTGYSGLYWKEYQSYFNDMKTYIQYYDMNVYLSNDYRDINFARENNVTKTILIPNGAGEDEFTQPTKHAIKTALGIPNNHRLLLHVGSYTGSKGQIDAIKLVLKSKHKNISLLMIGNDFENFNCSRILKLKLAWNKWVGTKKIIYGSYSREFTVDAYRQSDLFLFPSNIECSPIVLFECAAAKLPFMSTDVGNAVEIASWTKGGDILPTVKNEAGFSYMQLEAAVKQCDALLDNPLKLKKMAKESHAIWEKKFSWEKITKQYEQLYLSLTQKTL